MQIKAWLPGDESSREIFFSFIHSLIKTAHDQNMQPFSLGHTLWFTPGLRLIALSQENNGLRNGINWPHLGGFNIHSIKEGRHSSPESTFTLHSFKWLIALGVLLRAFFCFFFKFKYNIQKVFPPPVEILFLEDFHANQKSSYLNYYMQSSEQWRKQFVSIPIKFTE